MDKPLREQRVALLINRKSGSYAPDVRERMEGLLSEYGISNPTAYECEPQEIEDALKRICKESPDLLVVLAGDGTIRAAAEGCVGTTTCIIPLPGGTMNMLPKALYGDVGWEEALRTTLAAPAAMPISCGVVGEKTFFIAAIFGSPTLWTDAREALRKGKLATALAGASKAFRRMFTATVSYTFSPSTSGEATTVAVLCPLISNALHDRTQALEAAVIDVRSIGDVLGLASVSAFGEWRDHARVTTDTTESVRITSGHTIPFILDGERMELGKELAVTFRPEAIIALVPKKKT